MIDREWAEKFAEEWIEAWNSHDLGRILSHYDDDFEMASPLIAERMRLPEGRLKGKARVGEYWSMGLAAEPPLRFELIGLFPGVDSIVLHYRSVGRRMAAEVLVFNERGLVVRGMAHYGGPA